MRPKAPKRDRVTREEVRKEIYGKLRPGVPVDAEASLDFRKTSTEFDLISFDFDLILT